MHPKNNDQLTTADMIDQINDKFRNIIIALNKHEAKMTILKSRSIDPSQVWIGFDFSIAIASDCCQNCSTKLKWIDLYYMCPECKKVHE